MTWCVVSCFYCTRFYPVWQQLFQCYHCSLYSSEPPSFHSFLIDKAQILRYNNRILHSREMKILEITTATTMGEMLEYDMGIAYVLMQCGMHCVGCPSSIGESLEEACAVHGLNPDDVLAEINAYLESRETV